MSPGLTRCSGDSLGIISQIKTPIRTRQLDLRLPSLDLPILILAKRFRSTEAPSDSDLRATSGISACDGQAEVRRVAGVDEERGGGVCGITRYGQGRGGGDDGE